jgi:type II secretory pathway pseudopilin PulG
MTLLEVLVAIGLSGLLLGLMVPALTSTVRATRAVDATSARTAGARTALELLTRTLRTEVRPSGQPSALVSVSPSSVAGYSLLNRTGSAQAADAVPTLVAYSFDGQCLVETTTAGSRTTDPVTSVSTLSWTAAPRSRCVVRTATAPGFRYFTTAVLASDGVDTPALTVPAGGLTDAATLSQIMAIEITVTVRPAGSTASTQVLGRVTLSNVVNGAVAA